MKFEYHVKPTGNDAACGDAEHPFATISKAAQMASPGDTGPSCMKAYTANKSIRNAAV